jgi:hypothetical protein
LLHWLFCHRCASIFINLQQHRHFFNFDLELCFQFFLFNIHQKESCPLQLKQQ